MRLHVLAVALASLLCPHLLAQQTSEYPALDGFVTRVAAGGMDVNGVHLLFTPASLSGTNVKGGVQFFKVIPTVYLGEPAKVFGKADRKRDAVKVDRLILTLPASVEVAGEAMIDLLPDVTPATPATAGQPDRLLRADGRLLLLTPASNVVFAPPLAASTPLATNLWIRYRGEQRPDGKVLVREAEIRPNIVAAYEDKLRKQVEYDPAAVDADAHQNLARLYFFGVDPKRIPPWPDAAMQERVSRLGQRLIPAYQRALLATDPTRINFRFGVINEEDAKDAITLPNGIILIPHQVVERLENDDQLATVLADNIACALEKQTLRVTPIHQRMAAAGVVADGASIFVPGLGLAGAAAYTGVARHLLTMQQQQSGRASLSYLVDAGFDLTQAPVAWWRLGTKPDKPLAKQGLPPRAAYLFATLGTTWRSTVSPEFRESPMVPAP